MLIVSSNSVAELQTPEEEPPSSHHLPAAPSLIVSPPPDDDDVNKSTLVHVFRSKLPDLPNIPNHLPLHSYIFQHLPERSDNTCLIVGTTGQTYSFGQTHLLSTKIAAGLSIRGIKRGDVIMILLPNCAEFVFTFMAVSMIGATATTANPFYTTGEIFKQFYSANAKLIITQSQYVDKLRSAAAGDNSHHLKIGEDYTVITTDDHPPEDCLPFSVLSEANELETQVLVDSVTSSFDSNEAVALPYSSGTTGLPKGVILTHKCLITSVAQQVDGENPNLYLKPEDVFLCVCPLFHIYSLVSILLTAMRAGAAVLLMQKFEIKGLLELIERHRVSVAGVVPPLVLALTKSPFVAEYDLSSIRIVLSGAAPLGKELQEALLSRVPQAIFGQGYGMTEAGPVISMSPSFAKQPLPSKSGSCGTPMRNAELKVIDPESGFSLPHNQHGEICMRGSNIMKGYFNDDESTAATIDADGWLHTGDIGYVDDDGEVFIVDRVKELIKFKGFQVAPAELEALLVSHSSIADAAVVPQKDEVAGEVPVAFIVASNGSELTEEAVKEFVAKQVVFYKKLHKVHFVDAIPKSPAGKILRKDLRAKLATLSTLP